MSNRPRIRLKIGQPLPPRRYTGVFVYKYRNVAHTEWSNWLEEIVLENTLHFPRAAELGDPEEARPRLSASSPEALVRMLVEEHLTARPTLTTREAAILAAEAERDLRRLNPQSIINRAKAFLDEQMKLFRIYSLGKTRNNQHLWKEYAGDHTGYCLEFQNSASWLTFEVRYDHVAVDLKGPERSEPYFLFYKTKGWKKEQEVRMLGMRDSLAKLPFDPRLLTRVILGRKIEPHHAATIRELVSRRKLPLKVAFENNL